MPANYGEMEKGHEGDLAMGHSRQCGTASHDVCRTCPGEWLSFLGVLWCGFIRNANAAPIADERNSNCANPAKQVTQEMVWF